MNALFGTVIKVFLTLVKAGDTVGQNDCDGTQRCDFRWDGCALILVVGHKGLYRPAILLSQRR